MRNPIICKASDHLTQCLVLSHVTSRDNRDDVNIVDDGLDDEKGVDDNGDDDE